jgi:hypothetical protein
MIQNRLLRNSVRLHDSKKSAPIVRPTLLMVQMRFALVQYINNSQQRRSKLKSNLAKEQDPILSVDTWQTARGSALVRSG